MKSFFIVLTFLLLLWGCADKNAFSKFDLDIKQELTATNLQSSKIMSNGKTEGIFSAIYLNEIYPESFNQNEYFFVYIYMKNKKKMHNPNSLDDIELTLKLNSKLPLKIKKLSHINRFSYLASVKNDWNRYYLVAFNKQGSLLSLVLESDLSSSAVIKYQKGEQ